MKTTKLYGGEVELLFDEEKHHYYVDGKRKDGVTTFLSVINKPALVYWAAKKTLEEVGKRIEAEQEQISKGNLTVEDFISRLNVNDLLYKADKAHVQERDLAAEIGTAIHKWVEDYIKGRKPEMPESEVVLNGVTSFLAWTQEHNVEFISSEESVYSLKHDYAGMVDIIANVDGAPCIVDIKTSNGIYDEMRLQVAAYRAAKEEESGQEFAGRWIIRLGKELREDGEPDVEAHYLDSDKRAYKRDVKGFINAMQLYRWQKSLKAKS